MKSALNRLLASALCAGLLLMVGCESQPTHVPRTTKTVELVPGKPAAEVNLEPVTAVRLVLPGPLPGSDLQWVLASNNVRVLAQLGPAHVVPGRDGAATATEVTFYALEPGKSVIRFFLVPQGEKEATPAAAYVVTVRVDDN